MRHPVAEAVQRMATEEDMNAVKRTFLERCKALVSRGGAARKVRKVKRIYRKKSHELGVALNNALRQGCGISLARFAVPEEMHQRGSPATWPLLHLAQALVDHV